MSIIRISLIELKQSQFLCSHMLYNVVIHISHFLWSFVFSTLYEVLFREKKKKQTQFLSFMTTTSSKLITKPRLRRDVYIPLLLNPERIVQRCHREVYTHHHTFLLEELPHRSFQFLSLSWNLPSPMHD